MATSGKNGVKKLPAYDKGYRDGYMEGLNECSPLTGFTEWFSRRAKSKKLGEMKATERHVVVAEALQQYEAEGSGAKKRLLGNPSLFVHAKVAKERLAEAKKSLTKAKKSRSREDKFRWAMTAVSIASAAATEAGDAGAQLDPRSLTTKGSPGNLYLEAQQVSRAAQEILAKMCSVKNPSKAGAAAIGGVAGGLLLGPLGAAAGGYTGVKLKERASGKKAKRTRARKKSPKVGKKTAKPKKNPSVRQLVRDALK